MPERADDALRDVRAHLDDAHAAADRLVREAQRQAEDTGGEPPPVPPSGWASPGGDTAAPDLRALMLLIEAVREAVPTELTRQLAAALRELLIALRALLDWYIERLGDPDERRREPDVEDIPLD